MPDASDRRYYSAPSRGHASEQVASLQKQKQRRPRQQRRAVSGYAMKLCTVGACCICVLFYEEMKNMLGVNRAQQRVVENGKPASKQRPKGARQASHASERKAPRLTFDQVVEQASRGLGLVNNGTSNSCGLAGRSNVSFMIVGDWGHHPGYQNQLYMMQREVMQGMKMHAEGAKGASLECIVSTGDQVIRK
jgi:hypothetical protein